MALKSAVISFRKTGDDYPLPGVALALEGSNAVADYRCWINGFVDFDIALLRNGTAEVMVNEAMIAVDDDSFETTFQTFLQRFRELNAEQTK